MECFKRRTPTGRFYRLHNRIGSYRTKKEKTEELKQVGYRWVCCETTTGHYKGAG